MSTKSPQGFTIKIAQMILFQNTGIIGDAVKRTFEISPDTIYGVLLGIILIAGGIGWYLYVKQNKEIQNILKETVSVERSFLSAIENQGKENIKNIQDVKEDILRHIQDIASRIR